jgi:hypothetical protein
MQYKVVCDSNRKWTKIINLDIHYSPSLWYWTPLALSNNFPLSDSILGKEV